MSPCPTCSIPARSRKLRYLRRHPHNLPRSGSVRMQQRKTVCISAITWGCWRGSSRMLPVQGKVRLVYIDPPFATQTTFHSRKLDHAYEDTLAGADFVESLRWRLILLRELLAGDGSMYLHLDEKMVFHMKVIMDEVFGPGTTAIASPGRSAIRRTIREKSTATSLTTSCSTRSRRTTFGIGPWSHGRRERAKSTNTSRRKRDVAS